MFRISTAQAVYAALHGVDGSDALSLPARLVNDPADVIDGTTASNA